MDPASLKKNLAMVSGALALAGVALSGILFLVVYAALDSVEKEADKAIGEVANAVNSTAGVLQTLEKELNSTDSSLEDAGSASRDIGNGIREAGEGVQTLSERLQILETLGILEVEGLKTAGSDLVDASDSLGQFSDGFADHRQNILEFKGNVQEIHASISNLHQNLRTTRLVLGQVFGGLKLAAALASFSLALLFGIVLLQSLPDLMALAAPPGKKAAEEKGKNEKGPGKETETKKDAA